MEDVTGLKLYTESTKYVLNILVEERSVGCRRYIEKYIGDIRSANADMSNDNMGEKPIRRKSKVSCSTLIGAGLVGPKMRLKSVVDG